MSAARQARDVIVVRHGSTDWSVLRRHTGRTDVVLSAAGEAEAVALRPLLAARVGSLPLHVFASPLARALQTQRLADPEHSPTVDSDLMEVDYGDLEGLTGQEIRERHPGWDLFTDGCPGGESLDDIAVRCDRFRERIESLDGVVLVFTHGHLSRILVARLLGFGGADGRAFWNSTGSAGTVRVDVHGSVLVDWNVRPPLAG